MERHSHDSREALLSGSLEDSKSTSDDFSGRDEARAGLTMGNSGKKWQTFCILGLLGYVAVAVTIDVALRLAATQRVPDPTPNAHFRLPQDVLEFEERPEWTLPEFPWNQEPSDELDAAWSDLLTGLNIRVKPEEMKSLPDLNLTYDSVQVDGGDYMGVMGVFHHLHCLNNMRIRLHWDYYESKYKAFENRHGLRIEHSDHCIDTLRQAVMCNANTAIAGLHWEKETSFPANLVPQWDIRTTCVNWQSLDGWARERALRPGQFSYLPPPPGPYETVPEISTETEERAGV
ncbi:hypothetical protein GGR56DRAFT_695182 [Xylariaceae sp. FL0804]|nr:hypothetical protein GGR56DRAFT_695182 [Xylariaceae sp. FL0804]